MPYSVKIVKDARYADFSTDCGLFDAYLPETDQPVPALVYFHGGGLEKGSKWNGDIFSVLAGYGIAIFDVNYRKYPEVGFPVFVEDCARAVAYLREHGAEFASIDRWYIGGTSAGGWLSMMLHFDKRYLAAWGIDSMKDIAGYLHDTPQPTTHFNVLRERGIDTKAIRVDEAAPLYYIDRAFEAPETLPECHFIVSENDMPGRVEQVKLTLNTMFRFGYPEEKVIYSYMPVYTHGGYVFVKPENGTSPFIELILKLIRVS